MTAAALPPSRVLLALAGYAAARAALPAAHRGRRSPAMSLDLTARNPGPRRTNYRGRQVSLAGGPALAAATSVSAAAGAAGAGRADLAAASLLAGLAAGALGRYDDVVGSAVGTGETDLKGLRGHLSGLRRGRVSTGVVKMIGLAATGVLAAAVLPSRAQRGRAGRAVEVALGAGLIAGTANLINLLDLRPGRALKTGLLLAATIAVRSGGVGSGSALAGPSGAAAALLGDDLAERVMLGDAGANALGAVLGVAAADRTGPLGRGLLLAGVVALTLASERVSFTKVIESTPGLREWDRLGRACPPGGLSVGGESSHSGGLG